MAVKTKVKFKRCSPYDTFRTSSRIWKDNDVHDIPVEEAKQLVDTYPNMFEFIKELTPFQKAELMKIEKKKAEDVEKLANKSLGGKTNG